MNNTMIDLFIKGGPLMYPLLLGSILMLAVVIERSIILILAGIRSIDSSTKNLVNNRQIKQAEERLKARRGAVPKLIKLLLSKRGMPINDLEDQLSLEGDKILYRLSGKLHLLNLIGRIAPMVGLLGTVMGMVNVFKEVASVQGYANPSLLAHGIWEALITTAAGLIVGIPAIICYHLFNKWIEHIAFKMKHESEEILSILKKSYD